MNDCPNFFDVVYRNINQTSEEEFERIICNKLEEMTVEEINTQLTNFYSVKIVAAGFKESCKTLKYFKQLKCYGLIEFIASKAAHTNTIDEDYKYVCSLIAVTQKHLASRELKTDEEK